MSSNGHIAVYEPKGSEPFCVIYIENIADPDSLVPVLTPFLEAFGQERKGLKDVECLAAWLVRELIDKTNPREFLDIGICKKAHERVDYHYAVKTREDGGCTLEYRGGRRFDIGPF